MEWDLASAPLTTVSEEYVAGEKAKLDALKNRIAFVKDAFRDASRLINPGERLVDYAPVRLHSRAYFKLWEVLVKYPLINPQARRLHTLHLCEGPGSWIQCTEVFWTQRCGRERSLWTYYGVTLPNAIAWKDPHASVIYADLLKDELPPQCYHADLVTGDGGFEVDDENRQEERNHPLLAAQLTKAVKCCRRGGAIYVKMFDMFRPETRDLIEREVMPWFDRTLIVKPFGSRVCNSERFVLGIGKRAQAGAVNPAATARLREVSLGLVTPQTQALERALALAARPLDPANRLIADAQQAAASAKIAAWLELTK